MDITSFTLGESVKKTQALKVFFLLQDNPKMSQAQACANIGIDPKTYRKWIAANPEFLQKFEQAKIEAERLELAELLAKKPAVTEYFLQQAMKPGISLSERIKAIDHLNERIDELSSRHHTVDVEAEQDLLSGPAQLPGISKLANRGAVEEEGNETVSRAQDEPKPDDVPPE